MEEKREMRFNNNECKSEIGEHTKRKKRNKNKQQQQKGIAEKWKQQQQ